MTISSELLVVYTTLFSICIQHALGLQCYICADEDTNENCVGSNHVATCSITQNQCLTQVTYSRERGKFSINKACASLEGCNAATDQLSKYYFCDHSRAGWGCVECCTEDRCNESKGVNLHHRPRLTTVSLAASVVLLHLLMLT